MERGEKDRMSSEKKHTLFGPGEVKTKSVAHGEGVLKGLTKSMYLHVSMYLPSGNVIK